MSNEISADILEKINKGLESVRPYLTADGGDVELVDVSADNTVSVRLLGSCSGCQFSVMTLKAGIEQSIRKEWPELNTVEAV
jgi:Fe-S cluster biogenesis protein NfuA